MYIYLGVVHEELLGQDVPAGVRVQVGVLVQQPGDDVHMDRRVEVLQLLQTKSLQQKVTHFKAAQNRKFCSFIEVLEVSALVDLLKVGVDNIIWLAYPLKN